MLPDEVCELINLDPAEIEKQRLSGRLRFAEEENGKTTKEGVYAGGDAVTGAATVILAMGAGKAGAKGIHEYLSNK
jgi:NADPH-dependent glutamate synthase beta subunit-like oxidoreductase